MSEYAEGEKEFLNAPLDVVGSSWEADVEIDGGGQYKGLEY